MTTVSALALTGARVANADVAPGPGVVVAAGVATLVALGLGLAVLTAIAVGAIILRRGRRPPRQKEDSSSN